MHTLLILAALSSQITFKTTQNGDMTTIIPQVTLSEPCVCQVQITSSRQGGGGKVLQVSEIRFLFRLIRPLICPGSV